MGINVYRHVTVGDNVERLKAALAECLQRADMVITTGGLGPTMDDLTKETVAEFFGLPMERDEATYAWLKDHFEKRGAVMSPNNAKQADFPKGSRILPNRNGTAPGCVVEENGKVVIVLPGPPVELHDICLLYTSGGTGGICREVPRGRRADFRYPLRHDQSGHARQDH